MKTIKQRLSDSRGETLVESMCAILIFTLASIAFLTMTTTSANINATVTRNESEYRTELEFAEDPANAAARPGYQVMITVNDETAFAVDNVGIAMQQDGGMYAYYQLN